jgi:iron(III) transport system ATP-binding protein
VIKLENICKSFNGKIVLQNVSFKVKKGERFGIFGPSGCGKTTILRIVAGLEKPDKGKVILRNKCVVSNRKFVPPEERNVSLVFQDLALWPHMSVKEHIDFVLEYYIHEKEEREREINEILKNVNLTDKINLKPEQLSGGEKQRLALARSVAQKSDILLLDEPFSSLDIKLKEDIQKLFLKIHKEHKLTTVYVTHDVFEILNFCTRVARMENGRILEIGKPKKIVKKYLDKILEFVH